MIFPTQDRELVSILEDLQNIDFTGHSNSPVHGDCLISVKSFN